MPELFRIEAERLKLSAPFSRRIAEPFDADATGQATFYCCFDKVGCEKGERDGHIDLPHAALLTSAKLSDPGNSRWGNIIQPPTTARDAADQARPALALLR